MNKEIAEQTERLRELMGQIETMSAEERDSFVKGLIGLGYDILGKRHT